MKILLPVFLVVLLVGPLQAVELPLADLKKMEKAMRGIHIVDWQNKAMIYFNCHDRACRVSCEAVPDKEAPERPLKENERECFLTFTEAHVAQYLRLINKAKKTKSPQSDDKGIVTCSAESCSAVANK